MKKVQVNPDMIRVIISEEEWNERQKTAHQLLLTGIPQSWIDKNVLDSETKVFIIKGLEDDE